jgi:CheY-like chemotaxis protein
MTVTDNGTGMDAETQKHLFEPFFTTKPEGKGTGLGLALVYGVVQQSEGYINVRSALLVGSTFEVLLPATNKPLDEVPAPIAPLESIRGSESVLLIEEDEVVRKMVAGILTADGYRVVAVGAFAAAAREAGARRGVQLLIAPRADGGEKFARRLLQHSPALRILCTGQGGEAHPPFKWISAEHQAVLNKPYALSELLRAARKLLDA